MQSHSDFRGKSIDFPINQPIILLAQMMSGALMSLDQSSKVNLVDNLSASIKDLNIKSLCELVFAPKDG